MSPRAAVTYAVGTKNQMEEEEKKQKKTLKNVFLSQLIFRTNIHNLYIVHIELRNGINSQSKT